METKVVWLTGVPASGKTTIAKELQRLVNEDHQLSSFNQCIVLDADVTRTLWPELGLSQSDRQKNVARIGSLVRLLAEQTRNTLIVVACIAPYMHIRDHVLQQIGQFCKVVQVYLHAPLTERIKRDPKGLYQRAISGEITELTGYDGRYDVPESPHCAIDTSQVTPYQAATRILMEA
jgi:adenylyl-sulfate kinase